MMTDKGKSMKGLVRQHLAKNEAAFLIQELEKSYRKKTKDTFRRLGHTAFRLSMFGPRPVQPVTDPMIDFTRLIGISAKVGKAIGKLDHKRRERLNAGGKIIKDDNLNDLDIGRMHSSELQRHAQDLRHVKIKTPKKVTRTFVVQRQDHGNKGSVVAVMKPADPYSAVGHSVFRGPRCDEDGHVVVHSILGDADDFLHAAEVQGQFMDIVAASNAAKTKSEPAMVADSPEVPSNQSLDEQRALATWDIEMNLRRDAQKKLSKFVHRPEAELLMCTSDSYTRRSELRGLIQHREPSELWFWNLPDSQGTGTIRPCLPKPGRHPDIGCSGPPTSLYQQKGLKPQPTWSRRWTQLEYLAQKDKAEGGVIQIANQVLFDQLEIIGTQPMKPYHFDAAGSIPVSRGNVKSCDLSMPSEETIFDQESREVTQSTKITGPALEMIDNVYTWKPSSDGDGCHSNKILKELFILMETVVGESTKGCVTFRNVGTTVLHYYWLKVPDYHPLPVARPKRRPFYFTSEEGIVLPNETVHVPMLFISRIPGYFTESWLLATAPILENGAKVKVTFKGVCRDTKDYSQQRQDIEDYLCKRQIETFCVRKVEEMVGEAIKKSSLQDGRLREDPIPPPSADQVFRAANPGLFYHNHIIKELWDLHNAVVSEGGDIKPVTTPTEELTGEIHEEIINIDNLRKIILSLPSEKETSLEEVDDADYIDLSTSRQDELMQKLSLQVGHLSFSPLLPWQPAYQWKYLVVYTQLQAGIDVVIEYSHTLASRFGLIIREEEPRAQSPDSKMKKGKKMSISKGKSERKPSKINATKESSPTERSRIVSANISEQKPLDLTFSSAHKYRKLPGLPSPMLALYDEKVYTEMYKMLLDMCDRMTNLLDH